MSQAVPTIREVRYHMDDVCAEDNTLIDELEFSDSDIIQSMMSCVDYANGSMGGAGLGGGWTVNNFPSHGRFALKQGTAAQLLRSKALQLLRNTLPINAGGITIDDQDKSDRYLKISELLNLDWVTYVGRLHHQKNLKSGFISIN